MLKHTAHAMAVSTEGGENCHPWTHQAKGQLQLLHTIKLQDSSVPKLITMSLYSHLIHTYFILYYVHTCTNLRITVYGYSTALAPPAYVPGYLPFTSLYVYLLLPVYTCTHHSVYL